jgi:hypothetical protein
MTPRNASTSSSDRFGFGAPAGTCELADATVCARPHLAHVIFVPGVFASVRNNASQWRQRAELVLALDMIETPNNWNEDKKKRNKSWFE